MLFLGLLLIFLLAHQDVLADARFKGAVSATSAKFGAHIVGEDAMTMCKAQSSMQRLTINS